MNALLVQGMAWGDEGKGATVDFLAQLYDAKLVIRFNGGSQAAHNVVTPEGDHHTFAQFGSASLIPGVRTHLSRYMLVDPLSQMNEAKALRELGVKDIWDRLTVDKRAVVITPFHKLFNRYLEEDRGTGRHGSCGMGIGTARQMSLENPDITLYAEDLWDKDLTKSILRLQLGHYRNLSPRMCHDYPGDDTRIDDMVKRYFEWPGQLVREMQWETVNIFEGAQGVLLDETHGEAPYNTWTDCTFNNAFRIMQEEGFEGIYSRIGCFRTYFTRHGPGPFPTEYMYNPALISLQEAEKHNGFNQWQRNWRVGSFDYDLARKAIGIVGGLEGIALSHNDVATLDTNLAEDLYIPICVRGYGPRRIDRYMLSTLPFVDFQPAAFQHL